METSPEQRLYDAVARSSRGDDMTAAAAQAIAAGLDSPALRTLAAGTPAKVQRSLLPTALDQLEIPRPDPRAPGQVVAGTPYARLPTDTLRLGIVDGELGPEVTVQVNDLKITEPVGGMGMHPFDLLVPGNLLMTEQRVIVGRCGCGSPGCGSTEALITRAGGVVHWDWYGDVPMDHGVSFDATQYDAEVAAFGNDLSWRPPMEALGEEIGGMEVSWAGVDPRDPQRFLVALFAKDEQFLVYVRFPANDRDDVLRVLSRPPKTWRATYHSLVVARRGRPSMAGRRWRSEDAWG